MTMEEAQRQGWKFTGATYRSSDFDERRRLDILDTAHFIMKEYKDCVYIIATGGKDSWLGSRDNKALMGNDNFCFVYNHISDSRQKVEEYHEQALLRRRKEYEEAIARENEDYIKKVAIFDRLDSLKK